MREGEGDREDKKGCKGQGEEATEEITTGSTSHAASLPNVEVSDSSWERMDALCKRYQENLRRDSLEKYAGSLGVSIEALEELEIGFDRYAYTFPMRDADGRIVGFRQRSMKGGKTTREGDRLGMFIPRGVTPANVEVIGEGETDAAAALTLEIPAIGIPGSGAIAEEVARYIGQCPVACPCIAGDNDPKGKDGAQKLAGVLLSHGVPCRVLIPPNPYKDMREWLRAGLTRQALLEAIDSKPIQYPDSWPPGYFPVSNALLRRGLLKQISPEAFTLACTIASYSGVSGKIFPGRAVLAGLIGKSVAMIDRYKRQLEEAGILTWRRGRTGRTNEYRLNFGPERWKHGGKDHGQMV